MEDFNRQNVETPEDLSQEDLARYALDMFHRIIVHYTLWFTEVEHQSAGLVEYRNFGKTIDSRIRCECIGCPPDTHPEEWFCAWRFSIPASV